MELARDRITQNIGNVTSEIKIWWESTSNKENKIARDSKEFDM